MHSFSRKDYHTIGNTLYSLTTIKMSISIIRVKVKYTCQISMIRINMQFVLNNFVSLW